MYLIKTAVGRGYTVAYPFFEGDGCGTVNKFYETLADCAVKHFESLIEADRHTVCRAVFSVEDEGDTFTVKTALTLRRCGRRCGEKTFTHRWRRWQNRDAVLVR